MLFYIELITISIILVTAKIDESFGLKGFKNHSATIAADERNFVAGALLANYKAAIFF